ncbi:MAG: DUF3572 domain-containing protein [Rhodomicrobiaceae bacterium]|jgi:predicted chitinase
MQSSNEQISMKSAAFIAIKSLAYISQSPEEITKFMALTGIEGSDIIRLKENLKFLGGVLDFVTSDESLLLAFCSTENISPEGVEAARIQLLGSQ